MHFLLKFEKYLIQSRPIVSLGLFRVAIGVVLLVQSIYWIKKEFILKEIIEPPLKFTFHYFEFVKPFSEQVLHILLLVLVVCSILIIVGKYFRVACFIFVAIFSYFWLLDKGYYNNHYYFFSLMVFLLGFTNADKWKLSKIGEDQNNILVPNWQYFILQFQIFIIFFIAGLNKLNPYWMFEFQPMMHILATKAEVSGLPFLKGTTMALIFSYVGLLFDLLIGFLLWMKKTRRGAVILVILFNLSNFFLFYNIGEIGFFPFFLIASMFIFAEPSFWSRFTKKANKPKVKTASFVSVEPNSKMGKWLPLLIILFVVFQVLFPFRHLVIPGHVDYTGQGQRFSWRMKIMYKMPDIQFYFTLQGSEQKQEINVANVLTDKQYTNLIYYPDFVPVVARHLKQELIKKGATNPKITADFKIGFMGHEMKPLFDPNLDLTTVQYHPHFKNDWIYPLNTY